MVPVVVIEVAAPTAHPDYAASLTQACNRSVLYGQCVLAGADAPDAPDALAIISWRDNDEHARVQVGVRRTERWIVQDLEFEPGSAEVERWRAVGLAIASLIGELPDTEFRVAGTTSEQSTEPTASPPHAAAPTRSVSPAARPASSRSDRPRRTQPPGSTQPVDRTAPEVKPITVEAGAETGPGLAGAAWRGGIYARAGWQLPKLPLKVEVRADYARALSWDAVLPEWWTVAAGPTLEFGVGSLELDAGAAVVYEAIDFSARNSRAQWDHATRRFASVSLRSALVYPAQGVVSLLVGASAFPSRVYTVRNEERTVGQTTALTVTAECGAVLRLP